jgi:hypothetical protein
MTKQEVINYIVETPGNTNPAVLSTILNEFGASDNKQEIEFLATENGVFTPHEGKVFNKVTVNVPAPASDITTATVTAIYGGNDLDIDFLAIPIITNDVISIDEITEGVFTVPLYKGVMKIGSSRSEATSGNCEKVGDYIVITGDCTITVK